MVSSTALSFMRGPLSPSKDSPPRTGNLASVGYSLLSVTSVLGTGVLVGVGTFVFRKRIREALTSAMLGFAVAMTSTVLGFLPLSLQRTYWLILIAAFFILGIVALARNLARPSTSKE